MKRPNRSDASGRAYLDLQNLARKTGRGTQELLVLYALERFLARLAAGPYAGTFVLKGGMLLAALNARRATVDADLLATHLANFGDPVTPAPVLISYPALRENDPPVKVLGYPLVTVLAEKITTAIDLGATNSRVRDYADIWTLMRIHDVDAAGLRAALVATAEYRGISLRSLAVADLGGARQHTYAAYRQRMADDGSDLPETFEEVIAGVIRFADPVLTRKITAGKWQSRGDTWR